MLRRTSRSIATLFTRYGMSMQTKLIIIFLLVKVLPLFFLTYIAWRQFRVFGDTLREIAVDDSTASLNDSAVKNIERLTTDTALKVADFLYGRDDDILYLAKLEPTEENYRTFANNTRRRLIKKGRWELAPDGKSWIDVETPPANPISVSSNVENNDMDGFHSIPAGSFEYANVPLYDEITFVGLDGRELVKVVTPGSTKRNHPMDPARKDVSKRENTFIRAETYFPKLKDLKPGEIYVSDVIGAYVGTNYIGMYTPDNVAKAAKDRGYDIPYRPEEQAYSGKENPNGRRFEGIVRWATPVVDAAGKVSGYVTFALNHDHIMEFVDHITPMDERYVGLPSAYEGNYAFIWDYNCRSICHPRHHSITGFDPETGDPQIPWLESSIYDAWKKSGVPKWFDYLRQVDYPVFFEQSRAKKPAPALTRAGFVGLDGRYLNNAPQCIGWMDLTGSGGSGSFYILWSGLYKLNTAGAIPYYTGQYAPTSENNYSRRGFGFVAVGSGLDYFTRPAREMEEKLVVSINDIMRETVESLIVTTLALTVIVIIIAIWMAWHISQPIKKMSAHMSRLAIGDIAEAEVPESAIRRSDEIGLLARSLQELTESRQDELAMANAIAKGDYTRSIPLRSDLDLLSKAFNAMVRINNNALTQVNNAVEQMGRGANAVSDVSVSLSQGVQTSESVLKNISETIDTVDQQAQDNAVNAGEANDLAVASRNAAERGYNAVTQLTASMAEIQDAGRRIASVAKLIDDIAFQTNLLALNASVEAARAGRHGKGFSVVADEVRNLSARSAKAAHETEEMVAAMVALMETGTQLAEHSDREFREIVDTTARAASLFGGITDASKAQSASLTQLVNSVARIDEVNRENSHNAHQMASSAGALLRQALELRQMLSRFRLRAAGERPERERGEKRLLDAPERDEPEDAEQN